MNKKIPRILIIRCGLLGDTIDSTVIVKPLVHHYGKDLMIDWVTKPNLHDLFTFDRRISPLFIRFTNLPLLFNFDKFKIIFNSYFRPYDAVINLEVSSKFDSLVKFLKAKIKVGRPYKHIDVQYQDEHRVDHQLRILKSHFSNINTNNAYPYLNGSDIDVKRKYNIHNRYIVMCPTNSHIGKKSHRGYRAWPIHNWKILIDKILKKTDLDIVVTGTSDELNFIDQLDLYNKRIHNLSGRTSIPNLVNIMKYGECTIATDSGSVHVAGASARKVIALHGPTPFKQTGPYGNGENLIIEANINLHCSPCYNTDVIKMCKLNKCMLYLTPDIVFNYIIESDQIQNNNNVVSLKRII